MGPLRIRRADAAPGCGDEYFARVPESVLTDRDLSPSAVRVYAAVALAMATSRNPTTCLDPMAELGRLAGGISERQTRRLVAELERRGHVARERVRTIAGSPQGIRPTAQLRRASNRSNPTADRPQPSDCNRTGLTGAPDRNGREAGHPRPGDRTPTTAPLKREGEKNLEFKNRPPSVGVRVEAARPTPAGGEGEEEPLPPDELVRRLREIGRGAWNDPGVLRQDPPGAGVGNSIPDAKDCTAPPAQPSRHEIATEHKAHYTDAREDLSMPE